MSSSSSSSSISYTQILRMYVFTLPAVILARPAGSCQGQSHRLTVHSSKYIPWHGTPRLSYSLLSVRSAVMLSRNYYQFYLLVPLVSNTHLDHFEDLIDGSTAQGRNQEKIWEQELSETAYLRIPPLLLTYFTRRIWSGSGITPNPDYLQNVTGTSLSTDTSVAKFSWQTDHYLRRYKPNCGRCRISQGWRILPKIPGSGSGGGWLPEV